MVYGAIDGFSRCILFLQCSDNNKSSAVLHLFQTYPAGKREALGALSPAQRDTSARAQIVGTGVVNALSPGLDFVVRGYGNNVPAKFLVDTGAAVTVISSQL